MVENKIRKVGKWKFETWKMEIWKWANLRSNLENARFFSHKDLFQIYHSVHGWISINSQTFKNLKPSPWQQCHARFPGFLPGYQQSYSKHLSDAVHWALHSSASCFRARFDAAGSNQLCHWAVPSKLEPLSHQAFPKSCGLRVPLCVDQLFFLTYNSDHIMEIFKNE